MFDPSAAKGKKAAEAQKKKILNELKDWAVNIVPIDLREGLLIDIKEVICGDPECAPVDTIITLVWADGGRGVFGIPLSPAEVQRDDLIESFPDDETLGKWKRGEAAEWPPKPPLRFILGDRVECRIGPHPVKGWAPGRVIKLYYSEPNWPPNMIAPYQIALHDGRLIFAPQDTDNVIRLRPPPEPDAPSSPEIQLPDDDDDYEDMDGEGDDEEVQQPQEQVETKPPAPRTRSTNTGKKG